MKKITCLALIGVLSASVSYAATNEVYSVNVVGFQKNALKPNGGFKMSCVPFEAGVSNTLSEVFGTNSLRRSIFLASCDKVILYDKVTHIYQTWAQWTNFLFYKANDGAQWVSKIQGNPELPIGSGFWLMSAGNATTNVLIFDGDVVATETQELAIVAGFQMLSYPFSTDLALSNASSFVSSGASRSMFLSAADRITIYNPDTTIYQTYGLRPTTSGTNWYKANDGAQWTLQIKASNEVIRSGEAFWYQAIVPFTWRAPNPYFDSIK